MFSLSDEINAQRHPAGADGFTSKHYIISLKPSVASHSAVVIFPVHYWFVVVCAVLPLCIIVYSFFS